MVTALQSVTACTAVWRHNHRSCSRTVTLKSVARMLRELGFLAHVFCWFHDVCMRVVASSRFLPSSLRFPWFYSVRPSKSRVNTSVWCWPLSDSPVNRKKCNHVPLNSLWQTVHFVRYGFSSDHFTVQLNAHTDLLNRPTHFNNSWILSASGNRCGFQVLQLAGSIQPCFVPLTDFNINTWLSFVLL